MISRNCLDVEHWQRKEGGGGVIVEPTSTKVPVTVSVTTSGPLSAHERLLARKPEFTVTARAQRRVSGSGGVV